MINKTQHSVKSPGYAVTQFTPVWCLLSRHRRRHRRLRKVPPPGMTEAADAPIRYRGYNITAVITSRCFVSKNRKMAMCFFLKFRAVPHPSKKDTKTQNTETQRC